MTLTEPKLGASDVRLGREEIEYLIPHRPPFLFVDEVTILQAGKARGRATWPSSSGFFEGHFPGAPIVPGVLLIEAAAQTAATMILYYTKQDALAVEPGLGVLAGVRRFMISSPTYPDEELEIDVRFGGRLSRFVVIEAEGRRLGDAIFRGQLVVAGP